MDTIIAPPVTKLSQKLRSMPGGRCRRNTNPATGLCKQTTETVFWVSSAASWTPEQWNEWIRGHWRIENGSHYVRDVAFAEDASRIRNPPHRRAHTLIRLQSAPRRRLPKHQKRQMAQRYRSQRSPKNALDLLRTKQPWLREAVRLFRNNQKASPKRLTYLRRGQMNIIQHSTN
jgi:hypothetical protein